eukprot:3509703-Rhodomonas_salina.2
MTDSPAEHSQAHTVTSGTTTSSSRNSTSRSPTWLSPRPSRRGSTPAVPRALCAMHCALCAGEQFSLRVLCCALFRVQGALCAVCCVQCTVCCVLFASAVHCALWCCTVLFVPVLQRLITVQGALCQVCYGLSSVQGGGALCTVYCAQKADLCVRCTVQGVWLCSVRSGCSSCVLCEHKSITRTCSVLTSGQRASGGQRQVVSGEAQWGSPLHASLQPTLNCP